MISTKRVEDELQDVAAEVMCRSDVPSPSNLVIELADMEERRQHLFKMLKYCRDFLENPIDEPEYQSMMDYLYMRAAKLNIDSDVLVAEVEFRFMVEDLATLPERNLWEAMRFIREYE